MEAGVPGGRYGHALLHPLRSFLGPLSWRNVLSWAVVIGVFLLLQWAVVAPFRVPTQSMYPTLNGEYSFLTDDRVLVNKWIYGLRYPFNRIQLPFSGTTFEYATDRIFRGRDPERWDIVVFKNPEEDDPSRVLVKRVVGLPGECIELRDDGVLVNGEPLELPPELKGVVRYTTGPTDDDVRRHILDLAKDVGPTANLNPRHEGSRLLILFMMDLHEKLRDVDVPSLTDDQAASYFEDIAPSAFQVACEQLDFLHAQAGNYRYGIRTEPEYTHVPPDCYFVLGDNSAESRDGRTFGWVPNELILGRAFAICWPASRWRDFTGFSRTWWGRALLYGIPAIMVCYELCISFVAQSWRIQTAPDGGRLRPGDRILVNRLALGVRLPFTTRRISRGRRLRRGEYAVFGTHEGPPDRVSGEPALGRVAAVPGDTVAIEDGGVRINGRAVSLPRPASACSMANHLQAGPTVVPEDCYLLLTGPRNGPESPTIAWAPHRLVYGVVHAVWWPLWRAQRLAPLPSPDPDRLADSRPQS